MPVARAGRVIHLLALLVALGCAPDMPSPVSGAADVLTVRAGAPFTIRLDANATTGFRWRLATAPDPAIATVGVSDYELSGGAGTGSGGTEVWHCTAVAAGKTQAVFEYTRPWEHGQPPIRTHAVMIHVQP